MEYRRTEDPHVFRRDVADWLLRDEVRHNLLLGLLETLVERPEVYPRFELRAVLDGGRPVAAALRTPPHNVVLARPERDEALDVLVDAMVAEGATVPGVVGALPEADAFARRYGGLRGVSVASRMDQAIHVLRRVEDVPAPAGAMRAAGPDDLDLVLAWSRAFAVEAGAAEARGEVRLWEDGEVVSMTAFLGPTAGGYRVGAVYTPPDLRRRGYATALVAAVSRERLAAGARFCLLYTDLANPTSNAIYQRIGYERVCDAAMIAFEASA